MGCARVTRYHLHLHNAHVDAPDEEGMDLADLDEARAQALVGIRDFLGHELKEGALDLRGQIDIADAKGKLLLTIPFVEAVTITMP